MGRKGLVCALLCLGAAALAAQPDLLQQMIDECVAKISSWEGSATRMIGWSIVVVVLGALVSAMQGIKRGWAQYLVIAVGVAISIITGVNNLLFPVDHKTLRVSVLDANQIVRDMRFIRERMNGSSDEGERSCAPRRISQETRADRRNRAQNHTRQPRIFHGNCRARSPTPPAITRLAAGKTPRSLTPGSAPTITP